MTKKNLNRKADLKVAIVHNWLWNMRGAEKCLDCILEIYPDADLYALFGDVSDDSPLTQRIKNRNVYFSWLNRIPWIKKIYRSTFPFWGMAVESWDFSKYDLVISSSASTVKGVITPMETTHVCYMYTPMRYIWDQQKMYLSKRGWCTKKLFSVAAHFMRIWDVSSSSRIDYLISISSFVSTRIQKYYRIEPDAVIYPPVDLLKLEEYERGRDEREEFYVMVSGFQENKGAAEAIQYAKSTGIELILIGDGPKRKQLERTARTHSNIRFTGWVSDKELYETISEAKGLLFLGIEDFGLVPVESSALGTPTLALKKGGALESVRESVTGVFVEDVSVESISRGINELENQEWSEEQMKSFARRFSAERFKEEFTVAVTDARGRNL